MGKIVSLLTAVGAPFFLLCVTVQNSPFDEEGPNFVQPVIEVDSLKSSIAPGDTIHLDSAVLVLTGNKPDNLFQVKFDSLSWTSWRRAGAFTITSLSDGKHSIIVNTKYTGGTKEFADTFYFFVAVDRRKPVFTHVKDTVFSPASGERVSFSTRAEGASPINYQWYKESSIFSGRTDTLCAIDSFTVNDTGAYQCFAANAYGIDSSQIFHLLPRNVQVTLCTLFYSGNGSTSGEPPNDRNSYAPGQTLTVLGNIGNLVKSGAFFNGWNSKADGSGKSYLPGDTFSMAASDVTLYARWKPVPTFKVTYNGNGNDSGFAPADSNFYAAGDSVAILGNSGKLSKNSYSFTCWNTKADGSGATYLAGSNVVMPSSTMTLFAQWTAKPTSFIIYFGNGADSGSPPKPALFTIDAVVTISGNTGNLMKKGYLFSGWNTKQNGSGVTVAAGATLIKGAGNDTLYAKWDGYSYTVTFADQGATTPPNPASKTVTSPATSVDTLPVAPVKTGYVFGGWFSASDSGAEFTTGTPVTANLTVYAKWIGISYTVTYSDQGATQHASPPLQKVTVPATAVGTLPAPPVKSGYLFGGWFTAISGGAEFTGSTPVTESITVVARWNTYSYIVTFSDSGATSPGYPKSKTVSSPDTTVNSLPSQPTKTNYTFTGWFTAKSGGTEFTTSTRVTAPITVYARWIGISYIVTFNDQNATQHASPLSDTVTYPATMAGTLPIPPIKTGFVFAGWYTSPNGYGSQFTATTPVTWDITVYAKWVTNYSYMVTFVDSHNNTSTTQTVNAPSTTVDSLPAPPPWSGHTFYGWTLLDGTPFTTATIVSQNVTVYAQWDSFYFY
jgi:uncharacterized repeat protein (TIGR02543 family)